MKTRMGLMSIVLLFVFSLLLWQVGCRLGSNDESSAPIVGADMATAETPSTSDYTASVLFQVIIPDSSNTEVATGIHSVPSIRPLIATQPPLVTFKIIQVNVGNSVTPTTTLAKTVQVGTTG